MAEYAGYHITDETGSALVAKGRGQSFYIWASDANSALIQKRLRAGWTKTGIVEGVPAYGDGRIWRWWIADGVDLVVWLSAGPHVDARLPTLDELLPLVRSTRAVAPTW